MGKILQKLKEVGICNTIIGCIKAVYYRILQKRYQFDGWHLTPYELRKYAQAAVSYVNAHSPDSVVDIGCGLGEIISHVKAEHRTGIDLRQCNIDTAITLNKHSDIDFRYGSFAELGSGQIIDYVITLNFMHGSKEEFWQPQYYKCAVENDIRHFLVDVVPDSNTTNHLDFSKILPPSYVLEDKLRPFLAGRYLLIYKKQ